MILELLPRPSKIALELTDWPLITRLLVEILILLLPPATYVLFPRSILSPELAPLTLL